jgi:hypothetical protein
MVVVAYLYARSKGWPKERAHFNLGKAGWPIAIIALTYGVFMIINLSWPRSPGAAWYDNYLVSFSLALILAIGIIVFVGFKASGHDLSKGIHDIETHQTTASGETVVERVGGVMGVPGGVDPENPYVVEDRPLPEPQG